MTEDLEDLKRSVKRWEKTLIVTLLLILAAFAFVFFNATKSKTPSSEGSTKLAQECSENLQLIQKAVEKYRSENEGKNPSGLASLELPEPLLCPLSKKADYQMGFGANWPENPQSKEDYYIIWCHSVEHRGWPRLDTETGLVMRPIDLQPR